MSKIRKGARFSRLAIVIFLLIFTIVLVITSISSLFAQRVLKREQYLTNQQFLNKSALLIEEKMNTIDKKLMEFISDYVDDTTLSSNITNFYSRYQLFNKVKSELFDTYDYIDSVYIYFENGESVYYMDAQTGSNSICSTSDFFDRNVFYDFQDKNSYPRLLSNRKTVPVYPDGSTLEEKEVLTYMKGLPIYGVRTQNAIQVNIKTEYIRQTLTDNYMPADSQILVLDAGGEIFMSTQQSSSVRQEEVVKLDLKAALERDRDFMRINLDGRQYSYIAYSAPSRSYFLLIPQRTLFHPIYVINISLILVAAVVLLIAVFVAFLIDKSFFQPVLSILQKLKLTAPEETDQNQDQNEDQNSEEAKPLLHRPKRENEFHQISGYIDEIVQQKDTKEALLNSYFNNYKQHILLSILNNTKNLSKSEQENMLTFSSDVKYYLLIVLQSKTETNNHAELVQMMVQLLESEARTESVEVEKNMTAFLMGVTSELDRTELLKNLSKILDQASEPNGTYLCIGEAEEGILSLYKPFQEAQQLLKQQSAAGGNALLELSKASVSKVSAEYPDNIEKMILKNIANKLYNNVQENIEMFFKYLRDNNISFEVCKAYNIVLLHNMTHIFPNPSEEKNHIKTTILNQMEQYDSLEALQKLTEHFFELLTDDTLPKEKEEVVDNNELLDKVKNYIRNHYMEDIGLNTVAEQVFLSSSYLGRIFKENTGITFTNYIINVRMEAAANLLLNKNISVNDVAEKVGYHSVQSFCRLFKSYYNCSPSEYRRKNVSQILE